MNVVKPPRGVNLRGQATLTLYRSVKMDPNSTSKTCVICHQTMSLENFYRQSNAKDGRAYYCKKCANSRTRTWKFDHPGKATSYTAEWAKSHVAYNVERNRHYIALYPERHHARLLLRKAVRDGQLIRPSSCPECGAGGKIDAHHDDYTKPLEVRWLCCACHGKLSRKQALTAY